MQAIEQSKTSMVAFREHLEQFCANFSGLGSSNAQLQDLGLILETYHVDTIKHCERVLCLATALGQTLGLNDWQLEGLQQGAYLHDLGKVTVPNAILCKTTTLDPKEWAVMKTHVEYGFYFASKIPGLNPGALDVIRYHHERWDGTGYPAGLKETNIPLEARIFAVCDVYDALISERTYKCAWTRTQALEQLRLDSGKHFDPTVVEAFIQHLTLASGNRLPAEIKSYPRVTGFAANFDRFERPLTLAC
jgi:HD-GYP domain-containing protein (c-di-GMP phosphodiesterase class II)